MNPRIIRQLKWAGSIAGALVAIGGFVALAAPITRNVLDSGPLPLASRTEIAVAVGQALQQYDAGIQRQQATTNHNVDLTTLGQLTLALTFAEHEAGPHPNFGAQQYIDSLKRQIEDIQKRLSAAK